MMLLKIGGVSNRWQNEALGRLEIRGMDLQYLVKRSISVSPG